jgi:CRISPR-associated protein Cas2
MIEAHVYLVAYDVSSPKRWRRVVKLVKPFCERSQLSVFMCRSTPTRIAILERDLRGVMDMTVDRLMVLDLGIASTVEAKATIDNPVSDLVSIGAAVL